MKKKLIKIIKDPYLSKTDKLDLLEVHIMSMPSMDDIEAEKKFYAEPIVILDKEEK